MRRVAAGVVSALFGFLGSVQAQGLSLSQLEAAARENASAVQLRKVETRAAAAEKDAAQALVGARVIGGVGVSDTREPVTTETAPSVSLSSGEGFGKTWKTVLVIRRLASRYGRKLSMQASTSIRLCLSNGSSIFCQ